MKRANLFTLSFPCSVAQLAKQADGKKAAKQRLKTGFLATTGREFRPVTGIFSLTVSRRPVTLPAGSFSLTDRRRCFRLICCGICDTASVTCGIRRLMATASRHPGWQLWPDNWRNLCPGRLLLMRLVCIYGETMLANASQYMQLLQTVANKLLRCFTAVCPVIAANLLACGTAWPDNTGQPVSGQALSRILSVSRFIAARFKHSNSRMRIIRQAITTPLTDCGICTAVPALPRRLIQQISKTHLR